MKTLNELRATFTTQHKCEVYLRKSRWPNGVACPFCGAVHPLWMKNYNRWQCKECHKQFTLTSKTIFHNTHLPLIKWFEAIWLLCNSPKGISAKQIQREVGVTYKVASVKYLGLYCDEFCYRWNTRKDSDGERFNQALKGIIGKRVQYSMLVA